MLHKPIIGFGNRAADVKGYYVDFLSKYGSADDWEEYLEHEQWLKKWGGGRSQFRAITSHSHIIEAWIRHGIMGMIFWLYVLFQIARYFRRDLNVVPQWFGFLALSTPAFLWNIFFSPFGDRVSESILIVCLLMTRAIRLGCVRLPQEMVIAIERAEKKV